jgi:hypothetical protein
LPSSHLEKKTERLVYDRRFIIARIVSHSRANLRPTPRIHIYSEHDQALSARLRGLHDEKIRVAAMADHPIHRRPVNQQPDLGFIQDVKIFELAPKNLLDTLVVKEVKLICIGTLKQCGLSF